MVQLSVYFSDVAHWFSIITGVVSFHSYILSFTVRATNNKELGHPVKAGEMQILLGLGQYFHIKPFTSEMGGQRYRGKKDFEPG